MPIPSDDPFGALPTGRDDIQSPLYTDGAATVDEYRFQSGVCVLPIAENPPTTPEELRAWSPVVVLELHAPYRIRKAVSRSAKSNNPPVAPAPENAGLFVFVGGSLVVHNALNQTLLNYDWTVTTEYTYVENCVSRTEDGFVLGSAPWTWATTPINAAKYNGLPKYGAVSQAGADARSGYFQGLNAANQINTGDSWSYSCPTFYPGAIMSSVSVNGGPVNAPLPPA